MSTKDAALHGNICALSAEFHTHKLYGRFYRQFGSQMNGFTGIYDRIIDMAKVLHKHEKKHPDMYENGVDWIELVEAMVEFTLVESLRWGCVMPITAINANLRAKIKELIAKSA